MNDIISFIFLLVTLFWVYVAIRLMKTLSILVKQVERIADSASSMPDRPARDS